MVTREENELLTRTGPGTPCGELMRRYWQPAALSEELPVGGAPLPVRLLGEDLVLFRVDEGPGTRGQGPGAASTPAPDPRSPTPARYGLLGLHCSHRGADLSYGRLEDGGLRCIYHGWLYDINGRCLEQPGEPSIQPGLPTESGNASDDPRSAAGPARKIRHTAYPCVERAGAIFAYLGTGEPPEFPNYEFLGGPPENRKAVKYYHECNYLQANEGNHDLSHLNFLHYMRGQDEIQNDGKGPDTLLRHQGLFPGVLASPVVLTSYGLRSGKIRGAPDFEGEIQTTTEFVLPNFTAVADGLVTDARNQKGYFVLWHVPIDDTHHWKYTFDYSRQGPLGRQVRTEMVDYRPVRNLSNRYLQDREEMVNQTYSGLGRDFTIHDKWATEGEGPIQDRTTEHLGLPDLAVATARQVLLKAIRELQQGQEPANVLRDAGRNHFAIAPFHVLAPKGTDWEAYCQYVEGLAGPDGAWSRVAVTAKGNTPSPQPSPAPPRGGTRAPPLGRGEGVSASPHAGEAGPASGGPGRGGARPAPDTDRRARLSLG